MQVETRIAQRDRPCHLLSPAGDERAGGFTRRENQDTQYRRLVQENFFKFL
jgi:hypothetical protein